MVLRSRAPLARKELRYNQHAHDLSTLKEGDVARMKPFHLGSKEWKKRHDNIET